MVGYEPARIEEEIDLSEPVAYAVDETVQFILGLIRDQDDVSASG